MKYKLQAVMYHKGSSASAGHYTAAINCPSGAARGGGQWWLFDDESVVRLNSVPTPCKAAGSECTGQNAQIVDLADSDEEQTAKKSGKAKTASRRGKGRVKANSGDFGSEDHGVNLARASANAYMLILRRSVSCFVRHYVRIGIP